MSERYKKGIENRLKGNFIVALIIIPIAALIFNIKDNWEQLVEYFKW